jgi:hypothetical protein
MYELAHLPVKLNNQCHLYDNKKLAFSGQKDFTLLEVLDAIYWDISFMGGPEDNSDFLEEMKDRVESIETGDAKILTWGEADTVEKMVKNITEEDENNG